MHKSDRLFGRAAAWAGDARHRNRDVGIGISERALSHGAGTGFAHRAMVADEALGHAQHRHLGIIGIDDEAALDHIG